MPRSFTADDNSFVVERLKEIAKGKQPNTTYFIAKTIEQKGLIKASFAPNPSGRGRTIKIYDLTTKGRRTLETALKKEAKEKERQKLMRQAMKLIKSGKFSVSKNEKTQHSHSS